jgi:hypothetical protein
VTYVSTKIPTVLTNVIVASNSGRTYIGEMKVNNLHVKSIYISN